MITNPETQKAILGAIKEMSDSLTREQGEKDFRKSVTDRMKEEHELEPGKLNRWAKNFFMGKSKYQQKVDEKTEEECDFETITADENF